MAKKERKKVSFAKLASEAGEQKGVACPTCGCVRTSVVWVCKFSGLNRRSRKCGNPSCGRHYQTHEVSI